MNHWYFIAPIAAVSYIVPIAIGFWFGYKFRELQELFHKIRGDFEGHVKEEEDTSSAVVETTPQLIEKKRRAGKLPTNDDEESAIVTVKSPAQVRKEHDEAVQREIDERLGTNSHVIE